jgi:hypothetical protein
MFCWVAWMLGTVMRDLRWMLNMTVVVAEQVLMSEFHLSPETLTLVMKLTLLDLTVTVLMSGKAMS